MPTVHHSTTLAVLVPLLLWSLIWKGIALWKAARRDQPLWYIMMLLVNTVGILELLYIFIYARRRPDLVEEGRPPDF
jgi:methionyl-tRNA synthetase